MQPRLPLGWGDWDHLVFGRQRMTLVTLKGILRHRLPLNEPWPPARSSRTLNLAALSMSMKVLRLNTRERERIHLRSAGMRWQRY